jgi:hypothetical protein
MKCLSCGGSGSNAEKDTDMSKTLALDWRNAWWPAALVAMALVGGSCVHAQAQSTERLSASATPVAFFNSPSSSIGHSVITPRGQVFVTGHVGSMDTTTLPGNGGQGFLMNNGNGSSTLITPGGVPQTVFTPR